MNVCESFCLANLDLSKPKATIEIGTGYSLMSALTLTLLGFDKVITVDKTRDLKFKAFKKQLKYFKDTEIIQLVASKSKHTKTEITSKINQINECKNFNQVFGLLNISYIAPYTFEDILRCSNQFHYISSQVVLEHIPPEILNQMFSFIKQTLASQCISVHTINFIDHFANPGFFQDKSISEFNFLKYSDRYWTFWSGNSIAYTNRLSYLYYLELCKKHNLKVIDFIGENYRKRVALEKKLIHYDIIKKYQIKPNLDDLTKYQRGTLIIQNKC